MEQNNIFNTENGSARNENAAKDNELFRLVGSDKPNYIKVIGVGGGGGNAVNHMMEEGIQGVDFILCNTDYQALVRSKVPTKMHLGKRDLGAGNDPNIGREAALSSKDDICSLLDENTKMLFVTAGMGGGTGTGAAPIVAQIAKEKEILTVGIVTLPFECEGRRRKMQAQSGIEELRKQVDTLIVISSDKLRDQYGNMKLTEAFKKADDVLTTAAKGIAEIITVPGYVNVDFEDVKTVMKDSGKAIMGSGVASGEGRSQKAIQSAISSPLLNDSNIQGAKNILLYITSGTEEVSLDEVVEITEYTQEICGNCSDVIWGNGTDENLGDSISVTLIATGFDNDKKSCNTTNDRFEIKKETQKTVHVIGAETHPEEEKNTLENDTPCSLELKEPPLESDEDDFLKPIVHVLEETTSEDECSNFLETLPLAVEPEKTEAEPETFQLAAHEEKKPEPSVRKFDNPFRNDNNDDEGFEVYSSHSQNENTEMRTEVQHEVAIAEEQAEEYDPKEELKRQRLRALSLNFRTQKGLEELENQPAYMRRNMDINITEDEDLSRYSTSSNGISSENSFLHDNVD